MRLDNTFKTKTMARILVEQGQLKKAMEIYRYLLKTDSHQQDVKEELASVRRKLAHANGERGVRDLKPLYREWIRLEFGAK